MYVASDPDLTTTAPTSESLILKHTQPQKSVVKITTATRKCEFFDGTTYPLGE